MAKVTLFHYINELYTNLTSTDERSLIKQRFIEMIAKSNVFYNNNNLTDPNDINNPTIPNSECIAANIAAQELWNAGFFQKLGFKTPAEVKNTLIPIKLSNDQVQKLKDLMCKKIIVLRPRNTDPTNLEPITDYEKYLRNVYGGIGLAIRRNPISGSLPPTYIRDKYPHEKDAIPSDYEIIYFPKKTHDNNTTTEEATKKHYAEYYENELNTTSIPVTAKNKTDFLALLSSIKAGTSECAKVISNMTVIENIENELNSDTTNQTEEAGKTKIKIPGTFILNHQGEEYTIILKEETYQRIENNLKLIFGNSTGNNIIISRTPANALSVATIKKRNAFIIKRLNDIIRDYESRPTIGEENLALPELKKMLNILNFNEAAIANASDLTELIGGYVPNDKVDEILGCANRLAQPDINFDFRKNFENFLPIKIPGNRPADSLDLQKVHNYEIELRKAYRHSLPELFHTSDYDFKKGRKKYPHETFKWNGDEPKIGEEYENDATRYYDSVYGDYLYYRKNERLVKKITKTPGRLLKKLANLNEGTMRIRDFFKTFDLDDHKYGADGTTLEEDNKRFFSLIEKLGLSAKIAVIAMIVHFAVIGTPLAIPLVVKGILGTTAAMELTSIIHRLYNTYREMMEARVCLSYAPEGLKEALKYKALIDAADPVTDADKIETYKKLIHAHIAYYIANYRQFMRSYYHLKKKIQEDYIEEKNQYTSEKTDYQTNVFNSYWGDVESNNSLIQDYTAISRDEFDKKIKAIEKGRRLY